MKTNSKVSQEVDLDNQKLLVPRNGNENTNLVSPRQAKDFLDMITNAITDLTGSQPSQDHELVIIDNSQSHPASHELTNQNALTFAELMEEIQSTRKIVTNLTEKNGINKDIKRKMLEALKKIDNLISSRPHHYKEKIKEFLQIFKPIAIAIAAVVMCASIMYLALGLTAHTTIAVATTATVAAAMYNKKTILNKYNQYREKSKDIDLNDKFQAPRKEYTETSEACKAVKTDVDNQQAVL